MIQSCHAFHLLYQHRRVNEASIQKALSMDHLLLIV